MDGNDRYGCRQRERGVHNKCIGSDKVHRRVSEWNRSVSLQLALFTYLYCALKGLPHSIPLTSHLLFTYLISSRYGECSQRAQRAQLGESCERSSATHTGASWLDKLFECGEHILICWLILVINHCNLTQIQNQNGAGMNPAMAQIHNAIQQLQGQMNQMIQLQQAQNEMTQA